jgi:hypothetical protein
MNIVLTQAVANELKQKYTVLELDSMPHPDGAIPAFCVLPVESIAMEMTQLSNNVEQHEKLIDAVKNNDCETAVELCSLLQGKFGGELDSFYSEILHRIISTGSTKLILPNLPK